MTEENKNQGCGKPFAPIYIKDNKYPEDYLICGFTKIGDVIVYCEKCKEEQQNQSQGKTTQDAGTQGCNNSVGSNPQLGSNPDTPQGLDVKNIIDEVQKEYPENSKEAIKLAISRTIALKEENYKLIGQDMNKIRVFAFNQGYSQAKKESEDKFEKIIDDEVKFQLTCQECGKRFGDKGEGCDECNSYDPDDLGQADDFLELVINRIKSKIKEGKA